MPPSSTSPRAPPPLLPPSPRGILHRKLAVVGHRGAGKTSLIRRFVENAFTSHHEPTIEALYRRVLETPTPARGIGRRGRQRGVKQHVCCDIVDTAGHTHEQAEEVDYSRFLSRNALVGVHGYVLVYDMTSRQSFCKVQEFNDVLVRFQGGSPVPRVLVACMLDQCAQRKVGKEEGRKLARALGNIPFVEVSSKHNINVGEVFNLLLAEVEREETGELGGIEGGRGIGRSPSLIGGEGVEGEFLGLVGEEKGWKELQLQRWGDGYACIVS
ncbi:hypothetical protein VYU27_007371 [Nannochloropsis oceanica]